MNLGTVTRDEMGERKGEGGVRTEVGKREKEKEGSDWDQWASYLSHNGLAARDNARYQVAPLNSVGIPRFNTPRLTILAISAA